MHYFFWMLYRTYAVIFQEFEKLQLEQGEQIQDLPYENQVFALVDDSRNPNVKLFEHLNLRIVEEFKGYSITEQDGSVREVKGFEDSMLIPIFKVMLQYFVFDIAKT